MSKNSTPRKRPNISFLKNNILSKNNNTNFSSFINIFEENNNTNNTNITNISNYFSQKNQDKKYYLLAKKINLKSSKNNYYSTAVRNIFYDHNLYLENSYQGNKIIIGKNRKIFKELKEPNKEIYDSYDFFIRQNKRRKTIINNNKIDQKNNLSFISKKSVRKSKSFNDKIKEKLKEIEKILNTTQSSISYRPKGELRQFYLSDNELKLIYNEVKEREKKNKNKNIEFILNKTGENNIRNLLYLQERILKKKKNKLKINQEILDKIMNKTFKEKKNILMEKYSPSILINKKKIDKELTKFNIFNNTHVNIDTKKWSYNLRKNKNEEEKNKNNFQKEIIYYNKNLFTMENNGINNNKYIRRNLFRKIIKKKYEENKKENINKNNGNDFSFLQNLYIQGKNLLNHEIKSAKELIGKKKRLIQYNFNPDEISSILLAQSNPKDTALTPKAVINSMEIHNIK